MRRGSRKTKPISKEPLRCIVFLSSDEEHDEYAAERKENKQLNRINEFAKRNNLVPMKIVRRGIMGTRIRNEFFYRAIAYMKAGKADAIVAVNLDAISSGVADAYYKIGLVKENGFRLITVDEKEQYLYLYEPPKREMEATA
jgi:DNA invertase Pin-like site-specific DNA recombinase